MSETKKLISCNEILAAILLKINDYDLIKSGGGG